MTISVLVVEDMPEFLRRFTAAVQADPGLRLVGAATTVAAAKALTDATKPDVVLADLGLPDGSGIDLIRYVAAHLPQTDVLVITMFGDDGHVVDSIAAGASGYLMKDAQTDRIAAAIHEIRAGGSPISPAIARKVLRRFRIAAVAEQTATQISANRDAGPSSPLSERETEILRLVAKGLNFDRISEVLEISPHTVVTHIKRIYRKLAVHSRAEAVYEAQSLGLL